jgi:thiol-disulfide isomerase/thioredoxin
MMKFSIVMRSKFQLSVLLCITAGTIHGQGAKTTAIDLSDPAPPLRVLEWIKGEPVQQFEKGTVYVIEFWATWCRPCIAAMPHLSNLANEYKGRVIALGIDIYEDKVRKVASREKIKAFVDSMGYQMDYRVGVQDSNYMETGWLEASGEKVNGIPRCFVVNAKGKLAWIGHPKDLAEVLPKIVDNTWDIQEAMATRNLGPLDREAGDKLSLYADYNGKPDSVLSVINEIVSKEPKLKYAPAIAYYTFSWLLKTDPHRAYDYGKVAILTATYEEPAYDVIIDVIRSHSDKINLPAEIYELGAEACQEEINHMPYPDIVPMYKYYHQMAEFYWSAHNKSKAIESGQKAIDALKSEHSFSQADMAAFAARLQQYKKM